MDALTSSKVIAYPDGAHRWPNVQKDRHTYRHAYRQTD